MRAQGITKVTLRQQDNCSLISDQPGRRTVLPTIRHTLGMLPERPPVNANAQLPILLAIVSLSVLGCAIRPSPSRGLLFIPLSCLCLYFVCYTKSQNAFSDYGQSLWIATTMFMMSDYLLLTDVQNQLRRKNQAVNISKAPFLERLKWGFDLFTSNRGIGWKHEPASLPKTKHFKNGRGFILRQLLTILKCGLWYFIADVAIELNPSMRSPDGPPLRSQPWWLRPTVIAYTLSARSMEIAFCMMALLTVLCGLYSPDAWPPMFGSMREAYSVRNAWGSVFISSRKLTSDQVMSQTSMAPDDEAGR